MSPFSILNTSAICHVHGTLGPDTTLRPSASVPLRASPDGVVEEGEREREAALGIDQHEAPVANARHVVEHAGLELLPAPETRARGGRSPPVTAPRLPRPSTSAGSPAVTAPFSSRAQLSAIGYAPLPSLRSMPEKYRLAMRTRSARECRSAAGTACVQTARGVPMVSRLFAAASLRMTSVSISVMRRSRDLQAHDEDRGRVGLADRAHQHRLPGLDVGEPQRVAAAPGGRVPQAVAELEPLPVLGEHGAGRDGSRDGARAATAST